MDSVRKAITVIRNERELSQAELGGLMGAQPAQVSHLENYARNVTVKTLNRIFTALKADVTIRIELREE